MKLSFHKLPRPGVLWFAVATQVGSIIGLGIFGIPFVFSKTGFGVGVLYVIFLTFLVTIVYLLYGEIILRTHKRHQMVGYIKKYLGPTAHWVNVMNFWISVFGFIVATLIVNGDFVFRILSSFGISSIFGIALSSTRLSTIIIIFIGLLVYKGLKTIAKIDLIMGVVFVVIVFIIGIFGISHIESQNIVMSTGRYWFLPFGVVMFAMLGAQGVPLVREVLVGNENKLRKALIIGTILPAILYIIFAFIVVGVSGDQTSPEAILGLTSFLGENAVLIGSIFGFLASTTIFLSVTVSLNESMWQDFGMHKKLAFVLVFIPSYLLFRLEVVQFINALELVGGVAGGINMIMLIMAYVKAKSHGDRIPEYSVFIPNIVLYIIIGIFAFGAAYTILV